MTGGLAATFRDPRYLGWSTVAGLAGLAVFGFVTAIVPNPVFGRSIAPEPFAIATWVASAVLMGLLAGTYLVPPRPVAAELGGVGRGSACDGGSADDVGSAGAPVLPAAGPGGSGSAAGDATADRGTSLLGYAGGFAAFLAIGCPVCNKVALVALGTSGALSIWAPLQPLLAVVSLGLLAGALAWRLRMRARGNACRVA